MKVLIALNHPAHYFVFKFTALNLKKSGVTVLFVIKQKDVLEDLLICEEVEYIKICEKKERRNNPLSVISKGLYELIQQDINLLKVVRKNKPNLMIGTDISISHIGKLLNIPSFVFNEDDFEINKLFCKSTYPFATKIISPNSCSVGKFSTKKIGYNGCQKMGYLHPDYFVPNKEIIKNIVGENPYFVIRLVNLTSGHDIEGKHTGLTETLIDNLIEILSPKGTVFINSEGTLNPKYEAFRLKMDVNKMHHLLAFATLFIGDSQTMCAEAGLLGTPFIRFNDFVGKISYLNEIENDYQLGFGITTDQPEKVLELTKKIVSDQNMKTEWLQKQKRIFTEKIDPNKFYSEIILNQLSKK
jgi:predicted glycosyltransferase